MSGPIRHEDAFVVGLQLRDFPHREYWEYGRLASVCDLRAGETCIYDLKREPRGLLDKPYHTLFFYLPRAALDAIADEANASRIRDLSYISLARASVTSRFPASGACCCPPSVIPTKLTRCLSTTSCWRSGRISLRPMAACGQCGWSRVGSRHGRSDARRKFFAPNSRAACRSRRWRESVVCQRVISRTPSVARWEWRRTIG